MLRLSCRCLQSLFSTKPFPSFKVLTSIIFDKYSLSIYVRTSDDHKEVIVFEPLVFVLVD